MRTTRSLWSGCLFALLAPLACSSSSGDGSSAAGSPSSSAGAANTAGATASGGTGGTKATGTAGGTASGQAGASATAGTGGTATSSGGAGGSANSAGSSTGGTSTGGASSAPHSGAFDGSKCAYTNDQDFCACIGATCGGDTLNDMSGGPQSVYCGQCTGSNTCVGFASPAGGGLGTCQDLGGLTDAQKAQAAALTSIWENSTPTLAYAYAEDIKDYRGVTAGRAGFCSGTGDGIVVVQCITAVDPTNPLAQYVPALIGIEKTFVQANEDLKTAAGGNKLGNLTGLGMTATGTGGYLDAWKKEGTNADFKKCQDSVVDAVYYGPALQKWHDKKFTKALTIVSLWDAQLEQGESDPTFGMQKMIASADAQVTLSDPPTAAEESAWLGAFHKIRATIMNNYPEWKDNNYRVATYEMIRLSGDMDFKNCVDAGAKSAADYWPGLSSSKADSFTICSGGTSK